MNADRHSSSEPRRYRPARIPRLDRRSSGTYPAELDQALFSVANGLRIAAILLWPVIPGSCEKVLAALGEPADEVSLARAAWDAGTPGATVAPGDPLFPRVEVEESAA
jgi:methionyl-tRNA synthetase